MARQILNSLSSKHPFRLMLYMGIFSSVLVFLVFMLGMLAYLGTANGLELLIPSSFWIGAVFLMVSTYFIKRYHYSFKEARLEKGAASLRWALFFSLLFGICQFQGWISWWQSGVQFSTHNLAALLYISSAIHLGHILLGWALIIALLVRLKKSLQNQVDRLIVANEPFEVLKSDLLIAYWYYLDVIWLLILGVFFYTS